MYSVSFIIIFKPTEDARVLRLLRDGEQLPEPDRQLGLPLARGSKQQQPRGGPGSPPAPPPAPPLPPITDDDGDGDGRQARDRAAEPGRGRRGLQRRRDVAAERGHRLQVPVSSESRIMNYLKKLTIFMGEKTIILWSG